MKQTDSMENSKLKELMDCKYWPNLDDWKVSASDMSAFISNHMDAISYAKDGNFEDKVYIIARKFDKVMRRQASAVHHLCRILSEFRRQGSAKMKRSLAWIIQFRMEEYMGLEKDLLEVLQELSGEKKLIEEGNPDAES